MTTTNPDRLPLWRLLLGIAILGAFVVVIGLMTPVYAEDLRLHWYVRSIEKGPAEPDVTLVSEVVAKAHELNLPVKPGDVHIGHNGGKIKIDMRYVVEMHLIAWPVDLHFPTIR